MTCSLVAISYMGVLQQPEEGGTEQVAAPEEPPPEPEKAE